jgi:hypothetical protein
MAIVSLQDIYRSSIGLEGRETKDFLEPGLDEKYRSGLICENPRGPLGKFHGTKEYRENRDSRIACSFANLVAAV